MISFEQRLRDILYEREIPINRFSDDTDINRGNFFYRKNRLQRHRRHIYMAIAYYFNMDVEDLIRGTDAEIDFYGDMGI